MKKDVIFFDFDGTIVDTSEGIFHALEYAFKKTGQPVLTQEQMRKYIGPPLNYSFMSFNGMNAKEADEAVKQFRVYYADKGVHMHRLYDGVTDMLENLISKGKRLALATSKPEKHANTIIGEYGLEKFFDKICGATFDATRTTKKQVLEYAMQQIGLDDTSNAVLIGDTKNDVVGANEVGMDCIGVLYGFGTKEELLQAGAVSVATTPIEAAMLIE